MRDVGANTLTESVQTLINTIDFSVSARDLPDFSLSFNSVISAYWTCTLDPSLVSLTAQLYPCAWPSTLWRPFGLFFLTCPCIMSLCLQSPEMWRRFQRMPVIFWEEGHIELKLCLIVKSEECTQKGKDTHIQWSCTHMFQRMKNVAPEVTLNMLTVKQQITRCCATFSSHSDRCADRWSCCPTLALV